MTQERIDLANKFVDLILPRLVTQHADAISTNLDGLRLMLNRTDVPRIRADLEASANKLEKFLQVDTQEALHKIMVEGFSKEFTIKELKELIHQEEMNIRVQAVASSMEAAIEKLLQ